MQEESKLLLWRKSKSCLSLIDYRDFKIVKELNTFWICGKRELKELLAISDKKGENVIGVSVDVKDGSRIFHHYTKKRNVVTAKMDQLMPDLNEWFDIAMCLDQKEFFVAGTSSVNKQIGLLFAVFETTVPIKIATAIKVPDLNKATKIQRITGTDLFVIACEKDLIVSRYRKETKKLELVNRIRSVGVDSDISDFVFKKYFCFSVMKENSKLIILNFQPGKPKSASKKIEASKGVLKVNEFMNESFGVNKPKNNLVEPRVETETEREIKQEFKQAHEDNKREEEVVPKKRNIQKSKVVVEQNEADNHRRQVPEGNPHGRVIEKAAVKVESQKSILPAKPPLVPPRLSTDSKKKSYISRSKDTPPKPVKSDEKPEPVPKKRRNIQRVKVSTSYEKSPRKNPNSSSNKKLPDMEPEAKESTHSEHESAKPEDNPQKDIKVGRVSSETEYSMFNQANPERKRPAGSSWNVAQKSKESNPISIQKTTVSVSRAQKSETENSVKSELNLWKKETDFTQNKKIVKTAHGSISSENVQSLQKNSRFYSNGGNFNKQGDVQQPYTISSKKLENSNDSGFAFNGPNNPKEVSSENRAEELKRAAHITEERGLSVTNDQIERKLLGQENGQIRGNIEHIQPRETLDGPNEINMIQRQELISSKRISIKSSSQHTVTSGLSGVSNDGSRSEFFNVKDSLATQEHHRRKITEIAIPKSFSKIPIPYPPRLKFKKDMHF